MFDLVLRGGTVIDGTGAAGRPLDVGVERDRIAALGDLAYAETKEALDCAGLVVAPGFVDVHTHSDFTRLLTPLAESMVYQGVTTEIVGNCGFSAAPWRGAAPELHGRSFARYGLRPSWTDFDGYLAALDASGSSINCAALIGHNSVRAAVIGLAARPATSDEQRAMIRETAAALDAGAVGFSTGLAYSPGNAAASAEVVALAAASARRGGLYTTHIRGEDVRLIESVEEALSAARDAHAAIQLSHHPAKFPANGRSAETLAMIDRARAAGLDVTCDLHPYTSGATWMLQLLPPSLLAAGTSGLSERLRDPACRRQIRDELSRATDLVAPVQLIRAGRWEDLRFEYGAATPELIGRDFAAIARERRQDPFETWLDVMAAQGDELADAVVIAHVYDERDVSEVLRHPTSMIGSDGYTLGASGPLAGWRFHPRSYGTFPRVLALYVRERRLLSLPEAIHKMTAVPAERFKLRGRGVLAPGRFADVVAFDAGAVIDLADYDNPNVPARGVCHVVVNGAVVLRAGVHAGMTPGRALRRDA